MPPCGCGGILMSFNWAGVGKIPFNLSKLGELVPCQSGRPLVQPKHFQDHPRWYHRAGRLPVSPLHTGEIGQWWFQRRISCSLETIRLWYWVNCSRTSRERSPPRAGCTFWSSLGCMYRAYNRVRKHLNVLHYDLLPGNIFFFCFY